MYCVVAVQEDIVAVNQIFKDLGLLVHEQGDIIGQFCCRYWLLPASVPK